MKRGKVIVFTYVQCILKSFKEKRHESKLDERVKMCTMIAGCMIIAVFCSLRSMEQVAVSRGLRYMHEKLELIAQYVYTILETTFIHKKK